MAMTARGPANRTTNEEPAAAGDGAPTRGGSLTRIPFWAHALVLLVVLLGIVHLVDSGGIGVSDEGVVVTQVEQLRKGGWVVDHPLQAVDPDGAFVPIELSEVTDDGYLPYAKHVAYPLLLLPAWSWRGMTGLLEVSAIGTWLAAITGALLARRIGPRLDSVTLWVLGLGSPLVFGASVVMAHGPAAAAVGLTAICLLKAVLDRRPWWLVGSVLGAFAAVLLRSEGVLAVAGLGAGLCLAALLPGWAGSTRDRVLRIGAGAGLVVVAAQAYLFDGRLAAWVVGRSGVTPFTTTAEGYDLVGGRLRALWASVLRPDSLPAPTAALLTTLVTFAVVAASVVIRFGGTRPSTERTRLAVGLIVAAAGLAVVRAMAEPVLITGLVPAFPVLVAGLILVRRDLIARPAARVLLAGSVVGALAVWATSYPVGGSAEWGGRYFHVLLPLVTPVAVAALAAALPALGRSAARVAVAGLVVVSLALTVLEVRVAMNLRLRADTVVTRVADAADRVDPGDGGDPVVVSRNPGLARASFDLLDERRFLYVSTDTSSDDLRALGAGLADLGIERFLYVDMPGEPVPGALTDEGWRVESSRDTPEPFPRQLAVMSRVDGT